MVLRYLVWEPSTAESIQRPNATTNKNISTLWIWKLAALIRSQLIDAAHSFWLIRQFEFLFHHLQ